MIVIGSCSRSFPFSLSLLSDLGIKDTFSFLIEMILIKAGGQTRQNKASGLRGGDSITDCCPALAHCSLLRADGEGSRPERSEGTHTCRLGD